MCYIQKTSYLIKLKIKGLNIGHPLQCKRDLVYTPIKDFFFNLLL